MFQNKNFGFITTGLLSLSLIYCRDDSKVISISPYNTWRWTKCSMHWVETCRYLTWAISNSYHKARRVIRPTNQELVKSEDEDATEPRPLFEMVWADRNAVMKTDWQTNWLEFITKTFEEQRCLLSQLEFRFELEMMYRYKLSKEKCKYLKHRSLFYTLINEVYTSYLIDCYVSFNYSSLGIDLQRHYSTNN